MVSKKKTIKKAKKVLAMQTQEVFVVSHAKRRPYIEQFLYESVNFTQKHLGTICGFFIVRDKSSWSAHVVNFLTAEMKKEFFAVSKRKITVAFEAALHRGNRALAELAKHDNINWLGTIDGVFCAFDDKNISFSVTGDGFIYLIRDGDIICLSEDLTAPEAANNPLKTFVDTAHGPLRVGDKIIITSKELLALISPQDLLKNALRFSAKDFFQFINTALTNESTFAATTIIDVEQKTIYEPVRTAVSEEEGARPSYPKNAFGATPRKDKHIPRDDDNATTPIEPPPERSQARPREYVDYRTGHIYIKGDDVPREHASPITNILGDTKDLLDDAKRLTVKRTTTWRKTLVVLLLRVPTTLHKTLPRITQHASRIRQKIAPKKNPASRVAPPDHIAPSGLSSQPQSSPQQPAPSQQNDLAYKAPRHQESQTVPSPLYRASLALRHTVEWLGRKSRHMLISLQKGITRLRARRLHASAEHHTPATEHRPSLFAWLLPHPRQMKHLWTTMQSQTKWFVGGFIVFLILTPLLIKKVTEKKPVVISVPQEEEQSQSPGNTPSVTFDTAWRLSERPDAHVIVPNDTNTLIAQDNTIALYNNNDHHTTTVPLPEDSGTIVFARYMPDLSLLFFVTDKNTLYSFSPITKEFHKQKLPHALDTAKIRAIGAYLTYLYVVDDTTITRYARTEGGFDTPTTWLKDGIFADLTGMAIDGNVYIAKNGTLDVFFKHQKRPLTLPDNVLAQDVYATKDTTLLWVLDHVHKTLTAHDKETLATQKTFSHDALGGVTSFSIDEKTNTAFVASERGVYAIPLDALTH